MSKGIVKLWKQVEGYGFIAAEDGEPDVFVHQSVVEMEGYRYLAPGEPVEYEAVADGTNEDGTPRLKAFIHEGLSRVAGRSLASNEGVYASASETNDRNLEHRPPAAELRAHLLRPSEAVDLYRNQCSLGVSAKDLAAMGATLADGGVNP